LCFLKTKNFLCNSNQSKGQKQYYLQLERSQRGSLDITDWIEWFLECLKRTMNFSDVLLKSILKKSKFWQKHKAITFNERQRKIINLMHDNFHGNLTSSKWAKICKCSQDTANRDINSLLAKNILKKGEAGGRSAHYLLNK